MIKSGIAWIALALTTLLSVGTRAETPTPLARGVIAHWEGAAPQSYVVGQLALTWRTAPSPINDVQPVLEITGPGAARYRFAPGAGIRTSAYFGVGLVDPKGGPDQVLVSTDTGGAHCCTQIDLLEQRGGLWTRVKVGTWDSDPSKPFPVDVDGDAVPDLVMTDNRFLYTFASYAGSSAPPQIINVIAGKVADVSRAPRYRVIFQADMDKAKAGCLAHNNGACAAFVADAKVLGVNDWAWPIMIANFDPTATDLYSRCAVATIKGECPPGHDVKPINFPQSLAWFLTDTGYSGPAYPLGPIAPENQPSFDCARATTAVLQLICATPSLARRDRLLLQVYARALKATSDKDALREAQRAWIRLRDALPASVTALTRIYDTRIHALTPSSAR
jgi:hypothetical protein